MQKTVQCRVQLKAALSINIEYKFWINHFLYLVFLLLLLFLSKNLWFKKHCETYSTNNGGVHLAFLASYHLVPGTRSSWLCHYHKQWILNYNLECTIIIIHCLKLFLQRKCALLNFSWYWEGRNGRNILACLPWQKSLQKKSTLAFCLLLLSSIFSK